MSKKQWPMWPSILALITLTGISAWMLIDTTEKPNMPYWLKICAAIGAVSGGVMLVIGDLRERNGGK